ncbi:MAG: hypothetical protein C4522_18755 [Desulfobacteraceae bacterium]|nr:MAG: hypothetical protein C4522_18755 [Desulfobacteraceae bacterium]
MSASSFSRIWSMNSAYCLTEKVVPHTVQQRKTCRHRFLMTSFPLHWRHDGMDFLMVFLFSVVAV